MSDMILLRTLLKKLRILGFTNQVKEHAVWLQRKYSIKLADSIILATAKLHDMVLVTADRKLARTASSEVEIIMYEYGK